MQFTTDEFGKILLPAPKQGGFNFPGHYVWCSSVIEGDDEMFHMYASCWEEKYGFSASWLFHCKIAHAVSKTPQGPYEFVDFVFDIRERNYFDALNQHNPSINYFDGTYYLYYFGATYGKEIPKPDDVITEVDFVETWNRKRIGVATSKSPYGPWTRPDKPLLEPRDCRYWDCTITTNPSVAILDDGKTYMIYKSRRCYGAPLQLGIAASDKPDGIFTRLTDTPIFQFDNADWHIEDPFIWYQNKKFHLIMKDDFKNDCGGITGELGAGVYATSEDCINWQISKKSKVYSRTVTWEDGSVTTQANLERPNLLFDKSNNPTHLFLATGNGNNFWDFEGLTWNMCIPLGNKE